jgi:hypothetical protein
VDARIRRRAKSMQWHCSEFDTTCAESLGSIPRLIWEDNYDPEPLFA